MPSATPPSAGPWVIQHPDGRYAWFLTAGVLLLTRELQYASRFPTRQAAIEMFTSEKAYTRWREPAEPIYTEIPGVEPKK